MLFFKVNIRQSLIYAIYIVVCFLVQSSFSNHFQRLVPDVTLVFVVCVAYCFGIKDALIIGLIVGFCRDMFYGRYLGVGMLIFLYVAFFSTLFFRKLFNPGFIFCLLQVLLLTTFYEIGIMFLNYFFPILPESALSFFTVFKLTGKQIFGKLAVNLLIAIPMYFLLRFIGPHSNWIEHESKLEELSGSYDGL